MNILGISCADHDCSAALLRDGRLVAAAEEERWTREKHAEGRYPIHAARYCLGEAGLSPRDVDVVAYAFSPDLFRQLRWQFARRCWRTQRREALDTALRPGRQIARRTNHFRRFLSELGIDRERSRIEWVEHHLAHASSAYHLSDVGGADAAILTLDGVGELTCTLFARGVGGRIEKIHEMLVPDSLGLFYSTLTEFLGFKTTDGEYKVMGMSAYGTPGQVDLSPLVRYEDRRVRVAEDSIWVKRKLRLRGKCYSQALLDRLGVPRTGDGLSEPYVAIAAETQYQLETITLRMVDDYLAEDLRRTRTLCFAGGCALNVRLNRKLLAHPLIDRLIVPSGAHDAGLSLGAASYVATRLGETCEPVEHAYLGPSYPDETILETLNRLRLPHARCADPCDTAARLLAGGEIVGWFQGRMEFGPRALGNRSILAHPATPGVSDQINERIKFRETWRPFCPSFLEEDAPSILGTTHPAPFMNLSFMVDPAYRDRIPEVVHVDGSARAQTVSSRTNPLFHRLISRFRDRTGLPAVLNTSLNRRGEPIVNTPEDAIAMFFGSGLDYMILGSYLLEKTGRA